MGIVSRRLSLVTGPNLPDGLTDKTTKLSTSVARKNSTEGREVVFVAKVIDYM